MTVKELIEELKLCDPELPVTVSDYDAGRDKWGRREAEEVTQCPNKDGELFVMID
ncbi:MAG: hypothetical protein KAJ19_20735 [Gammaproteobacteria bacterium]|nr:hypothetical protein [Gammaproteobacteria bacterium]